MTIENGWDSVGLDGGRVVVGAMIDVLDHDWVEASRCELRCIRNEGRIWGVQLTSLMGRGFSSASATTLMAQRLCKSACVSWRTGYDELTDRT